MDTKAWIFPEIKTEHVRYTKTYLQNVIVSLDAESFSMTDEEAEQRMEKYLEEYFNITMPKPSPYPKMPVNVSAQSEDVELFFMQKNVAVRYGGADYLSFKSSILPQLYRMRAYLQDVVGANCAQSYIRKINLWPCKEAVVGASELKAIAKTLLSQDLNGWVPEGWNGDSLEWKFQVPSHDEWTLVVRVRVVENDIKQKMFVLDTILDNNQIENGSEEDTLIEMNDVLYEVFHGCVSERVIATMKGEK